MAPCKYVHSNRCVIVIILFVLLIGLYHLDPLAPSLMMTFWQSDHSIRIRSNAAQANNLYTAHHTKECDVDVSEARHYSQSREDSALYDRFFSSPQLCKGVYVEIGALDGIKYSNTKFFEDYLNWTGVLIEGQPQNAFKLKRNRPRSKTISEAVCQEGDQYVRFVGRNAVGGIPDQMMDAHRDRWIKSDAREINVTCRPIGRMLRDAGIEAVDMFTLDVEGAELMVLRTMDWTIPVKVFVVEIGRGDKDQILVDLLARHGYHRTQWDIRTYCSPKGDCANNQVFENPNYTYG